MLLSLAFVDDAPDIVFIILANVEIWTLIYLRASTSCTPLNLFLNYYCSRIRTLMIAGRDYFHTSNALLYDLANKAMFAKE